MGCGNLKIVLASASERRKELLARLVDDFTILVSNFDESSVVYEGNIPKYVECIAENKGLEVANRVKEDSIIISADTIVTLNDEILGKPKDDEDAYSMLKKLSGKVHKVFSAVVLINTKTGKILKETLSTEVVFSDLTDEDIKKYIQTGEHKDKAGAYGIQGLGGVFVKEIRGCYYNVVGLPLNKLNEMLKKIN